MSEQTIDGRPLAVTTSEPKAELAYVSGAWLRDVRTALNKQRISQRQLADHLGISQATVSTLITGRQKRSAHVDQICDLLQIDPPAPEVRPDLCDRGVAVIQKLVQLDPQSAKPFIHDMEVTVRAIEGYISRRSKPDV